MLPTTAGTARARHHRDRNGSPPQPRALTAAQRAEVLEMLEVLHGERFGDLAPGEVYALLFDEGRYLCSESTNVPDPARSARPGP